MCESYLAFEVPRVSIVVCPVEVDVEANVAKKREKDENPSATQAITDEIGPSLSRTDIQSLINTVKPNH